MSDLVLTMKKFQIDFDSRGVEYYFRFKYEKVTGKSYPMQSENRARTRNRIKTEIMDTLILEGLQDPKYIKEYIDWVFDNLKPFSWQLHLLEKFIGGWLKKRTAQNFKSKENILSEIAERRKEEKDYAEYIGKGFYDNLLTKEEFWCGRIWRFKHLNESERQELASWQERKFSMPVRTRLKSWIQEFRKIDISKEKLFFKCMAKRRNVTLKQFLIEFHREGWIEKFTEKELGE